MLKWNEGLSLGVKQLDDDHKKLLDIINKLSTAIDESATDDVYEEIFSDLDKFVSIHFKREESFMQTCAYNDIDKHKKQHNIFASKVPEIKANFFATKDYVSAQKIVLFLTDWLVNHIINEDLKLIETFESHGLLDKKTKRRSFIENVINKTTNSLSFSKRIFLSVMIPIAGLFILSYFTLYNDYKNYTNIKNTSELSSIIYSISNLVHSLQIERGLSGGHISSNNSKFNLSLSKQRETVDKDIETFKNKITSTDIELIKSVSFYINIFNTGIISLDDIRKRVDNREISEFEEIIFYKRLIENIIDITSKIELYNLNKDISSSLSILSIILHYKENMGLKRAYGTIIIEKQNTFNSGYLAFTQFLNSKDILIHELEHYSSDKYLKSFTKLINSPVAKSVFDYEEKIKNKDINDLDSKAWFLITSKYIDKINMYEKELIEELDKVINKEKNKMLNTFFLVVSYTVIIVLITLILLYIFKSSTKEQIKKLTYAMIDLSKGGRNFKLEKLYTEDEIADMHDAYEITRIKLLKGDIYRQLYLNEKEVELKNYEKENAELESVAYIDSLTGSINRRKFEELASIEIARSLRYKNKLSFLLLDIDYFKKINDSYGHAAGDEILIDFVNTCKNMLRNVDTIARIGGEEFVIMLVETDEIDGFKFAQRLREKISKSEKILQNKKITYTVSIGISEFGENKDSEFKTIIDRADKALYEAKNSGRNKCVVYKEQKV